MTVSATHEGTWRMGGQDPWGCLGGGPKSMGIEDLDHWQGPKKDVSNGKSQDVETHRPKKTVSAILSIFCKAQASGDGAG